VVAELSLDPDRPDDRSTAAAVTLTTPLMMMTTHLQRPPRLDLLPALLLH
jgi:hypothetical protein